MKIKEVQISLSQQAQKDLKRVPAFIVDKLQAWIDGVLYDGLSRVRKISGYHDEPLQGKRFGQRSIRLSKSYRMIYRIDEDGSIELIEILEVNKHDY